MEPKETTGPKGNVAQTGPQVDENGRLIGEPKKLSELVGQKLVILGKNIVPKEHSKFGKEFAILQVKADKKLYTVPTSSEIILETLRESELPMETTIVESTSASGFKYYSLKVDRPVLEGDRVPVQEVIGSDGTVKDYILVTGGYGKYAIIQFELGDGRKVVFSTGAAPVLDKLPNLVGKRGRFEEKKSKNKRRYLSWAPSE